MPASSWIQSLIGTLDTDRASFVFAGDAGEFPTGFGNWGTRVKTLKQGILLKPDEVIYQDLINIKLKRSQLSSDMPAGRGWAHLGSTTAIIQMMLAGPWKPSVADTVPAPPRPGQGGDHHVR